MQPLHVFLAELGIPNDFINVLVDEGVCTVEQFRSMSGSQINGLAAQHKIDLTEQHLTDLKTFQECTPKVGSRPPSRLPSNQSGLTMRSLRAQSTADDFPRLNLSQATLERLDRVVQDTLQTVDGNHLHVDVDLLNGVLEGIIRDTEQLSGAERLVLHQHKGRLLETIHIAVDNEVSRIFAGLNLVAPWTRNTPLQQVEVMMAALPLTNKPTVRNRLHLKLYSHLERHYCHWQFVLTELWRPFVPQVPSDVNRLTGDQAWCAALSIDLDRSTFRQWYDATYGTNMELLQVLESRLESYRDLLTTRFSSS